MLRVVFTSSAFALLTVSFFFLGVVTSDARTIRQSQRHITPADFARCSAAKGSFSPSYECSTKVLFSAGGQVCCIGNAQYYILTNLDNALGKFFHQSSTQGRNILR